MDQRHEKLETLKLLEHTGSALHDTRVGEDVLNECPVTSFYQGLRLNTDKGNFIKLKSSAQLKKTTNLLKMKPAEWDCISASYTSDRALTASTT